MALHLIDVLHFDFHAGTISDGAGEHVGSLDGHRRGKHRFSRRDLGFLDAGGRPEWWLRPFGLLAWDPDLVLDSKDSIVGAVSPYGLRLGSERRPRIRRREVDGRIKELRNTRSHPAFQVTDGSGQQILAVIKRSDAQPAHDDKWTLEFEPSVSPSVRPLILVMPALCSRWWHSD